MRPPRTPRRFRPLTDNLEARAAVSSLIPGLPTVTTPHGNAGYFGFHAKSSPGLSRFAVGRVANPRVIPTARPAYSTHVTDATAGGRYAFGASFVASTAGQVHAGHSFDKWFPVDFDSGETLNGGSPDREDAAELRRLGDASLGWERDQDRHELTDAGCDRDFDDGFAHRTRGPVPLPHRLHPSPDAGPQRFAGSSLGDGFDIPKCPRPVRLSRSQHRADHLSGSPR